MLVLHLTYVQKIMEREYGQAGGCWPPFVFYLSGYSKMFFEQHLSAGSRVRAGYNRAWGVTDEAYFLVFGSLHAGLGRLALMPLVVLASRICPKVKTLTLYLLFA